MISAVLGDIPLCYAEIPLVHGEIHIFHGGTPHFSGEITLSKASSFFSRDSVIFLKASSTTR